MKRTPLTRKTALKKKNPDRLKRRKAAYQKHLRSAYWKDLRERRWGMTGLRQGYMTSRLANCEDCGEMLYRERPWHLAHKTYARFGHEDIDDVMVSCPACNAKERKQRRWYE